MKLNLKHFVVACALALGVVFATPAVAHAECSAQAIIDDGYYAAAEYAAIYGVPDQDAWAEGLATMRGEVASCGLYAQWAIEMRYTIWVYGIVVIPQYAFDAYAGFVRDVIG